MGGKNAIIVLDDANLDAGGRRHHVERLRHDRPALHGHEPTDRAQHRAAGAAHRAAGRARQAAQGRLRPRDANDASARWSTTKALEKVDRYVHIGLDEGARLLVGGERFSKGDCRRGCFYCPTVFDNVTPAMRIARDEIFGPVVCIIEVGSSKKPSPSTTTCPTASSVPFSRRTSIAHSAPSAT